MWSTGKGRAQFYPAQFSDFILYDCDHRFHFDRACMRCRSSGCAQLPPGSWANYYNFEDCSVADPPGACRDWINPDLPVRPEPRRTAMAMDHLGQCLCRRCMARRFGSVLLVRNKFREFQQNVWFARGGYRTYAMDVAVDNRGSNRCQAQR